jgi:dUTP pyrophosphatase
MEAKIKILKSEVRIPGYGRAGDAGLDLYSLEDCMLAPGERHLFKLGFAIELADGYVGLMWDRGGMATNHGIHTLAGVIDSNYRGEVSCVLYNSSLDPYTITKGDKIKESRPIVRNRTGGQGLVLQRAIIHAYGKYFYLR